MVKNKANSWYNKLGNLLDMIGEIEEEPQTAGSLVNMSNEVLRIISHWLGAEACVLFRREEDGVFSLLTHYGLTEDLAKSIDARRARSEEDDTSAFVSQKGHTYILEDVSTDRRFSDLFSNHESRSFVNIPVRSNKSIQYTIALISKPGQKISVEMIPILDIVGQQISIVLENALNIQHARSQSAIEERIRLGRDIHDEIAQSIGLAHMQTMIASDLLSKGRIEESQQELIELEKTLARLYLNTREELFNLRAYLDRGRNFVTALQEYLNDYSRYYQMATQLHIYDIQATQLSERAALQIEWIIKEALSNARKHSEAKKAEIIFRYEADQAVIAIVDDGKGFNPDDLDDTDSHHSGLQIMQERAQSIDGRLEIESQPDSGTRITIYVPKGI